MITRRAALQLPLFALPAFSATGRDTAITFNEDNSHYFFSRVGEEFTPEKVASYVDQFAGTQVREVVLSGNSQRTSFASKVWDPIWKGYDPSAPDDQPMFASTPKEGRAMARGWVHTAWKLNQQGLDPYALWIKRAREKKLSPWISMRMNDLHNVDDPQSYMHSDFWKAHPEYRRLQWRTEQGPGFDWRDRAFDYLQNEVRDYHFRLVEEYCERYDFDGLELDWMRFGFHFKPGQEVQGNEVTLEFMRRTRALLNQWEKKRGHKISLGARVPSRPETAWAMGMDGVRWANEGLIQMLVVTPFWASIETEIPIEEWRKLVGPKVLLAAGLEVLIRPYHEYKIQMNRLETVRGAAAGFLARGADRVYLFNYMDAIPTTPDQEYFPQVLRECGSLTTLAGKPRRHVVTYADTWAPGEAQGAQLPRTVPPGGWTAFRIYVGPKLPDAKLRMEIPDVAEVHVNGAAQPLGEPTEVPAGKLVPGPVGRTFEWSLGPVSEWVVLNVRVPKGGKIQWVEIAG
ncbi:MAG: hypothetical protein EBY17_11780 [Acidobacteriia bacterium]|nr:hypothetical protein [Terriglobia bacterium]